MSQSSKMKSPPIHCSRVKTGGLGLRLVSQVVGFNRTARVQVLCASPPFLVVIATDLSDIITRLTSNPASSPGPMLFDIRATRLVRRESTLCVIAYSTRFQQHRPSRPHSVRLAPGANDQPMAKDSKKIRSQTYLVSVNDD
jgi:hypothetical protein